VAYPISYLLPGGLSIFGNKLFAVTPLILTLGIIFMGIAFLITKKNARYLLAGYNTASPEVRAQFRLEPYLRFFKLFHIFLGLSIILLGFLVRSGFGDELALNFLVIYILLAYSFLVYDANRFSTGKYAKRSRIAGIVLIVITVCIFVLLVWASRSSKFGFLSDHFKISGVYGIQLRYDQIAEIKLLN